MVKYLIIAFALVFAALPASAHKASKFVKGPNGGHIVDAGGGNQHWELVASGSVLTLYITDKVEKPVDTTGGSAEARVLVGGKNHKVTLSPAGDNTLKGSGPFKSIKGMRVIVKTKGVGGKSYQARLTPMG